VAASAEAQQYEYYDYAEPVKQFCLVIPEGLQTVRGILVVCNYMGGDSRGYYTQDWYCEFMNLHDFAIPVLRVVAPRVAAHVITDDKDAPYRLQTFGNHQAKLFHWFGVVIVFVLLRFRAGGH